MIMSNIQESLGKGLGWIINSVVDPTINISKYKYLSGSSHTKLSKELDNPEKGLNNMILMIINLKI